MAVGVRLMIHDKAGDCLDVINVVPYRSVSRSLCFDLYEMSTEATARLIALIRVQNNTILRRRENVNSNSLSQKRRSLLRILCRMSIELFSYANHLKKPSKTSLFYD
jgi:hypothetical protein